MRIKKRTKYILSILFVILVGCGFMSQTVLAVEIPDIFISYITPNSDIDFNYGVLKTNASENSNYRNYLDTTIKANEFDEYDDMIDFNNTQDYTNYLTSQEIYEFNDESFNSTSGNFTATYNFDSDMEFYGNFDYRYAVSTSITVENYYINHLGVLKIYDNSNTDYTYITNDFSSSQSFGSIDFWMYFYDLSYEYFIGLNDNDIEAIRLRIYDNSIEYWNGVSYENITYIESNEWIHFSLDFECGNNGYYGLTSYEYQLRVNSIQYGIFDFYDNEASLNMLNISTSLSNYSTDYYCYLDSLGYTWNQDVYTSGNFTAMYSFENEIGLDARYIDFIDSYTGSYASKYIMEVFESHQSILYMYNLYEYNYQNIEHYLNYSQDGIIEFWSYQEQDYNEIQFYNDTNELVYAFNLSDYSENFMWNYYKIEYDCSNENIKLYVNQNLKFNDYFDYNSTSLYSFQLGSFDDMLVDLYYDAFGFISNFYHNYSALYNFDSEIGNSVDNIDFIDDYLIETGCSISVNETYKGHYSVLEIDSSPSSYQAYIRHNLDNQVNNVNFTIEFWSLQTQSRNIIRFYDSNGISAFLINLDTISSENMWNHYKINIDCLNGNYSTYVNDILQQNSLSFTNFVGFISFFLLGAVYSDTSSIMYYDAIGFRYYSNTGYWNATYSFENQNGLIGNNIDFVDSDINEVSEVINGYKGHKDVLYVNADSSHSIRHNIDANVGSITSLIIDFWFLYDDCSGLYLETRSLDYKMISYLRFYSTYVLLYYDGGSETYYIDNLDNWNHYSLMLDYSNMSQTLWINEQYQGSVGFNDIPNDVIQYIGFYKNSAGVYYSDAFGIYYNRTGNYDASFNFESQNEIDTYETSSSTYSDLNYLEYYQEHKDVMEIYDADLNGYVVFTLDFNEIINEKNSIEFWWNHNSTTSTQNYLYFAPLGSNGNILSKLYFSYSSAYTINLGGSGGTNIVDGLCNPDVWYHIRIDYDFDNQEFTFYFNNVNFGSYSFSETSYDLETLIIRTRYDNTIAYKHYIDGLGVSIYDNYSIGQNLFDYYDDYGNYNASFNCDNLDDFSNVDWINTETNIVDYQNEHISVISQYDNNDTKDSQLNLYFDDTISGTIEFYWSSNDTYKASYFTFYEGSSSKGYLRMRYDSMRVYDNIADYHLINVYDNVWYHIRIDFDCNDDTFDIYIDNIFYRTCYFWSNPTSLNRIIWNTRGSDLGYISYIDSIGLSWLSNYSIGQNLDYIRYNTYEIGSNYDEYLQAYSNTYELGSNQIGYLVWTTNDYSEGMNLYSDYITMSYEIFDNMVSEYNSYDDYDLAYFYRKYITSFGSNYDYGMFYMNGYWYINYYGILRKFDENFNYIESITLITGSESTWISNIILYNDLLYVYLANYDKFRVYNTTFDYQYTINLEYSYYYTYANVYDGYIYTLKYNGQACKYYINGTFIQYFGYLDKIDYDNTDLDIYQDKIYVMEYNGLVKVFDLNYTFLYYYEGISSISLGLNNFMIRDGFFYVFSDYTSWNIRMLALCNDYLQKGMVRTYYLYDSSSQLTGKLEIDTSKTFQINDDKILLSMIKLYTYSGSFNEITTFRTMNFIYLNESIEFSIHVQVGYRDFFKKLLINFSIIYDERVNETILLEYNYNANYKFDKMLMSMVYSQSNEGLYETDLVGINNNYFKNDVYGFRLIACLDLNQKFTKFYDFGFFSDEINISDLEIPEIPSDVDELPYWLYQVSNITYSSNVLITTTNFNYTYPYVVVSISVERFPYNPETIPYIQVPQITGNWGLFDFVRVGLNFIIYVLVSIPNIFILLVNFAIVAGYFIAYLIALFFNTLIMTYVVGGIMILFINVIGYWIVYGFTWFVDGIYIFITNIQRIILLGVGLIGGLIALVIWGFTGFQADYNAILSAVNQILFYITDFMLEILTVILQNIVVILFYAFAYVLCVELVLLKYYYTKARGFKVRSERIYESYLSYYLVIGYVIRFFMWIKNIITGWL